MPNDEEARPPVAARMVGATLASGYILLFADNQPLKWLVLTLMALFSIGLMAATRRVTTTTIVRLHLFFGLILEILIAIALPEVWLIFCLVAASTITAGVFGQRDSTSLVVGVLGACTLGVIGAYHNIDNWVAVTFALVVIGPVARSTSQILDVVRDNEAEALSSLSLSLDAIMWEQDVESQRMRTVAGSAESLTGFSAAEWAKLSHEDLVHPDDAAGFRSVESGLSWEGRVRTKTGKWRYVRETFSRSTDPSDGTTLLRGFSVDLNETIEAKQLADWRANHDSLTRMPNRSKLIATAEEAIGDLGSATIFVADVDRFKEMNETLGYDAGDVYLQAIGDRLTSLAQRSDAFAARIGADEFAILVLRSMTSAEIEEFVGDIVTLCSEPVRIRDASLRLGACVGVGISNGDGNLVNLLRRADTAVDQAKKASTTWAIAKDEDLDRVSERFHLSAQVEEAIASGQLQLYYQPKVDLQTREISGFEGLIRWHHPTRGVLAPWRFLEVIDISGHADAFDRLVIEQAVQFGAACHRAGHKVTMSLNLPGRALQNTQIASFIKQTCDMWSLPPASLIVELTEDSIDHGLSHIVPAMESIASIGCGLSIDDFGTGHSSLTRLKELPLTEMKIDKSFVMTLAGDPYSGIIVDSTINLAKMIGLECVAEGVEDEESAQILVDYGCTSGQGFLYSKPVPQADAFELLTSGSLKRGMLPSSNSVR